jgi:chromate reductase
VVSVSPGALGGFGANHHLRQSLVFLNMPTMPQPEAYIGGAGELFDESGAIKKAETKQLAEKFLAAFDDWVQRTAKIAA